MEIRGAVQGVGFRPFVYRLALELDLRGWVLNDTRGVVVEVEGPVGTLKEFRRRVELEAPPRAVFHRIRSSWLEEKGLGPFQIRHSSHAGLRSAVVLPDVATCVDCLREVRDPGDRRYSYPFVNCTNCGPRFTIVESLPYDRPNTTMRGFIMCSKCRGEYEDPLDRRFHAQPNACPVCGPRVSLRDPEGGHSDSGPSALVGAADAIRSGRILALKGLGGFHLVVDAREGDVVGRLRERKGRWEKPLALMVPDLATAERICEVSPEEAAALNSAEAPIVLLRRRPGAEVSDQVAPGNPYLGVMLPYTPLHQMLLDELAIPVVATSGNLSDEPICIDNEEAVGRLAGIADLFLLHDRPIARHADDSVVRFVAGVRQPVRRARGFAPLPVLMGGGSRTVLAVGAHLKNTVALGLGERVFLSQHIGDMETPGALEMFERVVRDFLEIYGASPEAVAHDLHPDYPSSRWAVDAVSRDGRVRCPLKPPWVQALEGMPLVGVQHHHAHLASCLADNDVKDSALGVTWDGTGWGPDGTVWGGEFLLGDAWGFRRAATMRPFLMLGGERAIMEPWRLAVAVGWELFGEELFEMETVRFPVRSPLRGQAVFRRMLETGVNSPVTTSVGRLFDAVSGLVGLRERVTFEGQAAMALEFVADVTVTDSYPVDVVERPPVKPHHEVAGEREAGGLMVDWGPTILAALDDLRNSRDPGVISARFHRALARAVVAVAETVGHPTVALTGGCFQNRLLTEWTLEGLQEAGFQVLIHRRVPPNDGGISLGQVAVATAWLEAGGDEPRG